MKYNIANPINVNSDGKNAINLMIAKVIADNKIMMAIFSAVGKLYKKSFCKKLFKIDAWISTPG